MSFVSWVAVICTAMQLVFSTAKFTGSEGKEVIPDWTKKLNGQLIAPVRGQRSPSVSRFKSGPVPGSWYYIMGHGRDSKRSQNNGSPASADRMENEINRLATVFPEDKGQSRRLQVSSLRTQLSPIEKQFRTSLDNRPLSLPVGAPGYNDDVTAEFVGERRIPGLEDISGQTMLNEFINFLAMKESNLLNNCNTDGRRD